MINKILLFGILSAFALFSCSYPKDPRGTLNNIRKTHTVKAGIAANLPWTGFVNGKPYGVEVNIITEIARHLGARVIWVQGSEQDLIKSLKAGELDIVAAGLTNDSPWKKIAGFTNPYFIDTITIGVPGAVMKPEIDKLFIGVKDGSITSRYLKEKGATPIRVNKLSEHDGPVAGSCYELRKMGMKILKDETLYTVDHVMAIVPGENAWLMYIEDFLANNEYLINKWVAEGTFE